MTIYKRIKNRRNELSLTAAQVAEALNVSRSSIYRYESKDIKKQIITAYRKSDKLTKRMVLRTLSLEFIQIEQ